MRKQREEMKAKTRQKITRLLDEYLESIGAQLIRKPLLGTVLPYQGCEWNIETRFGVNLRLTPSGQWVAMSFGYTTNPNDSRAAIDRMLPLLGRDDRYNKYSGKYNLWFAWNCQPADALSIFKGDLSLFIKLNELDGCRAVPTRREDVTARA